MSSTWSRDDEGITFTQPAQTMMSCEEPEGIMDQETALAVALTEAVGIDLTPGNLYLLDAEGSILLVARSA